ncbi:hypothetical protein C8R47DRAFT_517240 [Mycena vitilis]|nr:hypothetical protein C8R47DRAFT_517240 [Mycena vitilis]
MSGPFLALTALQIAAQSSVWGGFDIIFTATECVELICAAPRLVKCEFDEVVYDTEFWFGTPTEPPVYTSLQHLRLGQPRSRALHDTHGNSAFILRCLTLPALKSLDIAHPDIKSNEFIAFLRRSSQPLESLRMVVSAPRVEHIRFMPRLAELELWRDGANNPVEQIDEFLPPFLEAPGTVLDFLPSLRDLFLGGFFPRDYKALIVALRRRHGQLQTFQLIFPSYHNGMDPVDDGAAIPALRQLAADGMRIHIGPKDRNFV